MENNISAKSVGMNYYLKVAGSLTAIAVSAALLLSAVNMITRDRIEANRQAVVMEAVRAIFPDSDGYEEYDGEFSDTVKTVYTVGDSYCVTVTPNGFGGEIEMMVGIDPDGRIKGIRILEMSETPGLGTKVDGEYLTAYNGLSGSITLGRDVDAVSGATVSSKAVLAGVSAALEAYDIIAGTSVPAVESDEADSGNSEMSVNAAESASGDTTVAATEESGEASVSESVMSEEASNLTDEVPDDTTVSADEAISSEETTVTEEKEAE